MAIPVICNEAGLTAQVTNTCRVGTTAIANDLSSDFGSILGGEPGSMTMLGEYSTIIMGNTNVIDDGGNYNSVVNGLKNCIYPNANFTSILNGSEHCSLFDNSSILG